MKIEKFLLLIENNLLNYPDIDLNTIKLYMNMFGKCLSKTERMKFTLYLQVINDIVSKQISLTSFVNEHKTKELESELNILKKGEK